MTEHNSCGTPDCCGTCPSEGSEQITHPWDVLLDARELAEGDPQAYVDLDDNDATDLVAIAAEAMWDHVAGSSPQYIAPWSDQSEQSRRQFIAAFVLGLETMAHAQADR